MAEKKFFGFELQRFATASSGEEFIAALTSGSDSSVSLNADITLDGSVSVTNSNLTSIDLGGHTITYTGTGTKTLVSQETIRVTYRPATYRTVKHYGVLFFDAGANCSIDNGKFVAVDSVGGNDKTESLFIAKGSASLTFGTKFDFSVQSSVSTAVAEIRGDGGALVMEGVDVNYNDNVGGIAVSIGGSNNKVSINGGSITKKIDGGLYTKGNSNEITISGASISSASNAVNIDGKNSTCLLDNASLIASMTAVEFNNDSKVTIKSGYYESNAQAIVTRDTSNLTVEGGTITGSIGGVVNYSAGTADIQGGSITSAYVAVDNYYGNGTVNISGGTISGIQKSDDATEIYGVYNEGSGIVNITGGTISGYRHGVYNKGTGTVNISDGSIAGSYLNGVYNYTGTVDVSGGSIKGSNAGVYNEIGSASISGGSITGGNNGIYNYGNAGKVDISGGTISGRRGIYNWAYYNVLNISDGTVEGTDYGIYNSGIFSISGGSIKGAQGVNNYNHSRVTISGGTITGSSVGVQNDANSTVAGYGKLQINGGLITGTNYAVYNNGAQSGNDITITGGEFSGAVIDDTTKAGLISISGGKYRDKLDDDYIVDDYLRMETGNFYVVESKEDFVPGWSDFSTYNQWKYQVAGEGKSAKELATLAGASSILTLGTTSAITEPTTLLIDTATFAGISAFTILDGSAAGASFALNIIGNEFITSIFGGAGADSLTAGAKGASLNGGLGDDLLIGSKGAADTFIYSAGKDIISGYEIDKDNIVLTSISAITATDSLSVNDKSLTINFGSASALTFQNVSKVSVKSGEDTYYYEPTYIVHNGTSISLGAGYGTVFNVNRSGFENLSTIDGSKIKNAIAITGNGENNYIIGGISGGTLNGGDGDDILKGGAGEDIFVYTGGADSIIGYDPAKDLVSTAATFRPTADGISISGSDLILDFDGEKLTFINGAASAISLKSGRNDYTVTKDHVALGKGVTLTANNSASTFELTNNDTLDALLSAAVSIAGNAEKNYIIGSRAGGSIYGGAGNDRIDVTERNSDAKYIFRYTEGKDTVNGFSSDDSLTIDTNAITAAKATDNKFTITLSKDNVLALNGDDISKVFLTTGDSLTADGLISKSGESAPMSLKLFASAKGDIDLGGDLYGNDGITAVNASAVDGQAVNIIGTSLGGAFTFASNKKKDTFTYGGGSATLSNFETGYDKLNLGELSIGSFTVDSLNNVLINAGDGQIVLEKVAGNEVLIHHGALRSNSYAKMIFAADGVLADKVKATSVTLSSGAKDYTATDNVKKITFSEGIGGISATAGDKNNSTLDASVAGEGVTLVSGGKGDKFIGSANADLFVYTAGKDIIQNYAEGDQVSLNGVTLNDLSKVSASDKSVKLAFSGSNNVLNVKGTGLAEGGLTIDGKKYTFAKNAIIDSDEHASLTSAASGTIKTKSVANYIDGTGVKKNLTFSGGTDDETFIGGAKKTVFKGGGGDDTLIGGEGKDTFFYAKGSEGDVTIQKFDFINDNLKIANGTIGKISSISGGVEFTLTDGKKKDPGEAGSYKIESSATYDSNGVASTSTIDAGNILIKANSTYYWFAQEAAKDIDDNDIAIGDLITDIKSVAAAKITESDYNVIDLTYSTNLVKSGVAKQLKSAT